MTDLDDVIRLLRDRRPEATELELDEIKQRVLRRAAQTPRRAQPMKSRLAILAMLVLGFVFSTAGVGMAIGGLSGANSAAVSQYGPTVTPTPPGKVLGEEENNNGQTTGLQPERQVENGSSGQLPFTGFAAIPVLLGGIALLSGGLVLRWRSRQE
jgi:hypothetical protein